MTVSRCMNARRDGSATAITVSAPPPAKRLRASASTACGVVRSPMPIITAPRPIDEDVAAFDRGASRGPRRRRRTSGPHVFGREQRVEPVDRLEVRGLPSSGRHGHRVHGDAAVDPARRVPGEQVVRKRREHEARAARRPPAAGPRPAPVGSSLDGEAADEVAGDSGRGRRTRGSRGRRPARSRPSSCVGDDPIEEPRAGDGRP